MSLLADRLLSDGQWPTMPSADIALLIWAFVVHEVPHEGLVKAVGEVMVTRGSSSHIKEVVTMAWGMASLGYKNETVSQG